MGVEMACGELHGLAQHHPEGDFPELELAGYFERLADIVAVFHECLSGQGRAEGPDETLTLTATVDDYTF